MAQSRTLLIIRNSAYYVAALALSGVFLFTVPAVLLPRRHGLPVLNAYLRGILFLLKWICGLSYEVKGAEHLPAGPVLLASAHQSTWENLFFILILSNPSFVVKEELFHYPLVGAIARKNGYIPAYRTGDLDGIRNSIADAVEQADRGRSILIFPPGTRTGIDAMPVFRRGVAALYEKLQLPCVPIAHNSGRYWQHRSWLRYPGVITVEILPAIPVGLDKKAFLDTLSDELTEATERLLRIPGNPALMPELSTRAERLAARLQATRKAETG
ncbi:MAG: lysophospholipid acyltransferase family protein [Mesorhizobium sp.]|nr:lysophospholipid acyltransferase family protein [Mesorhizobium sp.]